MHAPTNFIRALSLFISFFATFSSGVDIPVSPYKSIETLILNEAQAKFAYRPASSKYVLAQKDFLNMQQDSARSGKEVLEAKCRASALKVPFAAAVIEMVEAKATLKAVQLYELHTQYRKSLTCKR